MKFKLAFLVRSYMDDPFKIQVSGKDEAESVSFNSSPAEPNFFICQIRKEDESHFGEELVFGCEVEIDRETLLAAKEVRINGQYSVRLMNHGAPPYTTENDKYQFNLST